METSPSSDRCLPDGGSSGDDASRGFSARVLEWLDATGLIAWGISFASMAGSELVRRRWPGSRWIISSNLIFLVSAVLGCFRSIRRTSGSEDMAFLGLGLSLGGLYFARHQGWAPPVVGLVWAGYFWTMGRMRRRPVTIMFGGCLLASLMASSIPWPPVDRILLVCVLVGVAVAVQGIPWAISYLRGERSAPAPEPKPDPVTAARKFGRLVYSMTGKLAYEQTHSNSIAERVRRMRASELAELSALGFEELCCYSESFPAIRLGFIFPLLVTLTILGKDVIRWHEGRIYIHYLVMVSADRTTYADASGLGVKLFAALNDGTFLVTENFQGLPVDGPQMFKRCQKRSIGETWAAHRCEIRARDSEGSHAVCDGSFPAFATLSERETLADLA